MKIFTTALIWGVLAATTAQGADASWVHDAYQSGDFKLAQGTQLAPVYVAPEDFECVRLAGNLFAEDIERVTGHKPTVITDATKLNEPTVIVGTLGQSPLIDQLAAAGKFDAKQIQGQWESYLITTVANPLPGVSSALVIAGSDRRGTAYGVFEVSRAIGVSPWYWWADATPDHQDNLYIAAGTQKFGPPSVKYRGIFINDEDWGMIPWASKTLDKDTGNIGPKTYAKICELLLRLKANTLWPAMHAVSTAFNLIPENKEVADRYGIVMGSSHCEPMLRNNVGEWPKDNTAGFNFITNPEGVTKYWEERMQTNGKYENVYTLGIRGIHDDPMMGAKGAAEVVPALEKIFGVQRDLIAKYVNPDVTKVPQIFCPYKEVLAYFLANLQVPPDVTVVFPDDNFGYIRYLPTPEQIAARPGGFGVYYHSEYLGAPMSYAWLDTTPPALMWEELSKAYDHDVQKFWMLNVGGLKPREVAIDFFMQMAWDEKKWNLKTLPDYLKSWATEQFGPDHAQEIADLMSQYYRLGYQRKPEHLQWNLRGEPARPSDLAYNDYGDEGQKRYAAYNDIREGAVRIGNLLPASKQAAFYELVSYPIQASALANESFIASESAGNALTDGNAPGAQKWAALFDQYTGKIETATAYYNQDLAAGKWLSFMPDDVLQKDRSYRDAALHLPAGIDQAQPSATPGIGVVVEGNATPMQPGVAAALPLFEPFLKNQFPFFTQHTISIFNTGSTPAEWTVKATEPWIRIGLRPQFPTKPMNSSLPQPIQQSEDEDALVDIDWAKAPHGADVSGNIVISDGKSTFTVKVPVYNPASPTAAQLAGQFVELNGVVSMEAEHFTSKTDKPGAAWQVIPGLGRTGDAVGVFPTTAPSVELDQVATDAPALAYKFYLFRPGGVTIHYNLIPTQPIKYGTPLRFAVAVDDGPPQLVAITAGTGGDVGSARAWQENVLNNTTTATTQQTLAAAGEHTLKIYMVDPGVLLEKIVIDNGGLRPSYLGPPETLVAGK
jgi:hypothetical protein